MVGQVEKHKTTKRNGHGRGLGGTLPKLVREGLDFEQILEGVERSGTLKKAFQTEISKFKGLVVEAEHSRDSKEASLSAVESKLGGEQARGRTGDKFLVWRAL